MKKDRNTDAWSHFIEEAEKADAKRHKKAQEAEQRRTRDTAVAAGVLLIGGVLLGTYLTRKNDQ